MLRTTFFEIFNSFLDELTFEDLDALGLPDMERVTLERSGYELVGNKDDYHAYEKEIIVAYNRVSLSLIHKLYFFANDFIRSGLDVEPKVRLTTLLKAYWGYRNVRSGSLDNIQFFFWEGNDEGAVVFEENIVVRFGLCRSKGAYLIETIESSLDKTGNFPGVAVKGVKKYMNVYILDCAFNRCGAKKLPYAFTRLVDFLCKEGRNKL